MRTAMPLALALALEEQQWDCSPPSQYECDLSTICALRHARH
jgi:hypothetical protein